MADDLDLPHCGDPDCGCPTERELLNVLDELFSEETRKRVPDQPQRQYEDR